MPDGSRSKRGQTATEPAMPADRQADLTITGIVPAVCIDIAITTVIRHEAFMIGVRRVAAAKWQHPETQD